MLHGQPTPTTPNSTNQPHRATTWLRHHPIRRRSRPRVGRDVRLEPVEETSPLELPNGHFINLGTGLNSDERAIITPILINNIDLFAWSTADLPRMDPLVASHKLSIYKEARYISEKKCKLGEER